MLLDPDVSRVSADAVRAVAKAAELMLENLAIKSYAIASSSKRSTVKFADVDRAARSDARYSDVGLAEIFANEDIFAAAREGKSASGRAAKQAGVPQNGRTIDRFFGGGAANCQDAVTAQA